MKTLRELEMHCTRIADFRQPAFVTIEGYSANLFNRANVAKLYYNNKDKYYLYMKIIDTKIECYNDLNTALERLNRFIYNTCSI